MTDSTDPTVRPTARPTAATPATPEGIAMTELLTDPTTQSPAPAQTGAPAAAPERAPAAAPPSVAISTRPGTDPAAAADVPAPILSLRNVSCYYGAFRAVKDVDIEIATHRITALIGPSGCGKSTLLRTINRMNDLIPGTRLEGQVLYHDQDLYGRGVDPVEVRRRIGMVFQKPNPFPKSIYDNVAFGPRVMGFKGDMDGLVESSLRRAAIWNEVKDKLKQSGLSLSGGQQQRLCIARAIATSPEIILMDEPCSALDPRATLQIEDLMAEIKQDYTIVIVTHNMQQAARASDYTVFMNMAEDRAGYVVEQSETIGIFTNPQHQMTEDYVSGRFG
jgi:phosphate transport system ATP-binding protein